MTTAAPHALSDATMRASVDPNVALAAERTLLAWIRTALALMGFGFVVARFGLFLRELAAVGHGAGGDVTPGPSLFIGIALVLLGIVVNVVAAVRHVGLMRRLEAGATTDAVSTAGLALAGALASLGIAIAAYLALFASRH